MEVLRSRSLETDDDVSRRSAGVFETSSPSPSITSSPQLARVRRRSLGADPAEMPSPLNRRRLPPLSRSPARLSPPESSSPVSSPLALRRRSIGDLPSPVMPERRPSVVAALAQACKVIEIPSAKALRNYHSKYDPREVLILRDYYNSLRDDARIIRGNHLSVVDEIKSEELRRDSQRSMAAKIFTGMFGQNMATCRFRDLLTVIYPNATDRDMESMVNLAFPDGDGMDAADSQPTPRPMSPFCTEEEVSSLEQAFDALDRDFTGWIALSRVSDVLRPLAPPEKERDWTLADLFDPTDSGRVTKTSWVTGMLSLKSRKPTPTT